MLMKGFFWWDFTTSKQGLGHHSYQLYIGVMANRESLISGYRGFLYKETSIIRYHGQLCGYNTETGNKHSHCSRFHLMSADKMNWYQGMIRLQRKQSALTHHPHLSSICWTELSLRSGGFAKLTWFQVTLRLKKFCLIWRRRKEEGLDDMTFPHIQYFKFHLLVLFCENSPCQLLKWRFNLSAFCILKAFNNWSIIDH